MIKQLGWINGSWSSLEKLTIPINDRSLNFGDGIFETILILNHKPQLLTAHFNRWKRNAIMLGMELPPNEKILEPIIEEGIRILILNDGIGSIRLNWSRGSNLNRGINYDSQEQKSEYNLWIELSPLRLSFSSIKITIDRDEKRNANSLISKCKTFNYMQSIQARLKAKKNKFDDALLLSTTGELCCGTTSNIIVKRNKKLVTPRLNSGCLPGIMREQAIKKGVCEETELSPTPEANDEWLLINSLSCHPVKQINNQPIKPFENAESFWHSLLIK